MIYPRAIDEHDFSVARPSSSHCGTRVAMRVLECIAGVAALAFMSGLSCVIDGDDQPHWGSGICFPLSEPGDAVADANGDIYVVLEFYGRVQVYNPSGRFKHGFFVKSGGGAVRLEMDAADNLTVLPARTDEIHVYDKHGNLLSSQHKTRMEFDRRWEARDDAFVDQDGRRYLIKSAHWDPRIVQEDRNGERTVLIQTPWLLRPLVGPLPCWVLFGCCGLIHYGLKRRLIRQGIASGAGVEGMERH